MEKSATSERRVAVVTGGNKGIGLEVCRQLASKGVIVVLTARDEKRGSEAARGLHASGFSDVVYHNLDVSDPSSAACLADFIENKFGKLDILINNAGVIGATAEIDTTAPLQHVYFGGEDLKQELNNLENLTIRRLDEMPSLFLNDYKNGQLKSHGWPADAEYLAYKVSKALINGYTRIMGKNFPALRINSVHPGYCMTDINYDTGELTAEEGASSIVMVALLPVGGPTGVFFYRNQVAPVV
ncbi:hypothetical protein ACQ4PT_046176 [Festuca glaucescens]